MVGTGGETYFGIPTHLADTHKETVRKLDAWFADMILITASPLFDSVRAEVRADAYQRRRLFYRAMSSAFLLDGDMEDGIMLGDRLIADLDSDLKLRIKALGQGHKPEIQT